MSRKEFITLVAAIATITDMDERHRVAELIANVCARHNQSFDYSRFYTACGV